MSGSLEAPGKQPSCDEQVVFDLGPLREPLWWFALVLLLVNDNVLKGSGRAPFWLTGKLSDFAFLVVAPVLIACLVPGRPAFRRLFACAVVSLLFSSAKLSVGVSNTLVIVLASLGIHWRLWPDATDLIALLALPAAWWLLGKPRPPIRPLGRRGLELAGLAIGALACLATSALPRFPHYPFFVNDTAQSQTVTLTWLLEEIDCAGDLASLAATLNPGDLGDAHTIILTGGQVAALDQPPADDTTAAGMCRNSSQVYYTGSSVACSGVVASVPGGPAVLVAAPMYWEEQNSGGLSCGNPPDPVSLCQPVMSTQSAPGDDALSLDQLGGSLAFKAGNRLKMLAIDLAQVMGRPTSTQSCGAERDQILTTVESAKPCHRLARSANQVRV